jgi:hypothetical protein
MITDEEIEGILLEHAPLSDVLDFIVARDEVRRIDVPLAERALLEDGPMPTLRSRAA